MGFLARRSALAASLLSRQWRSRPYRLHDVDNRLVDDGGVGRVVDERLMGGSWHDVVPAVVESAANAACFSIHPGAFPCSAVRTIKGFAPRLVSSPASLADRFATANSSMKLAISMVVAPSIGPDRAETLQK